MATYLRKLAHSLLCSINRDGEADACGIRTDRRVDANDLAKLVEQWTTRVAYDCEGQIQWSVHGDEAEASRAGTHACLGAWGAFHASPLRYQG